MSDANPGAGPAGVDVAGVAKSFGATRVLDGVSIGFGQGAFTSLLGASGSGKTTLLRIVAGFVAPDAGTVRIAGEDVTGTPVWARRIGMVFQSYALFPHMSVAENVAYGLHRRGVRGADAARQVDEALGLVRLGDLGDRRPRQLSGGQQQRVALARAIVTRPRVLLLDEPLSALDRHLRQEMQVELRRIQRESGLTTVFVTHDQEEALALSDRVAILDRGRIIQVGAPAEVYERPRTRFAASFLGDANILEGTAEGGAVRLGDGARVGTHDPLPADGTAVRLAVRPEKMTIRAAEAPGLPAPDAAANRLAAVVTATVYAGAALTYHLEGGGCGPLTVFAQNRDGAVLPPGSAVAVTWGPDHTILLED